MADYPVRPVPFTRVEFDDEFWSPRLDTNRKVTLPYVFEKCRETGRIENFLKAAGKREGSHEGLRFNDSDVYKVLEGASYTLATEPDPELDRSTDDLIAIVADAQEPDGYLYTARTIDPGAVDPESVGVGRWSNLRLNHELYNLGHLYEAAAAHHLATGKRSLLAVALKSADLVDSVFGHNGRHDVPGHQEIELGLAKLYRVTGEERYLRLAEFFLDERGRPDGRELYQDFGLREYMQDHLPVTAQREAAGHAVRAVYMYAAMADMAALAGRDDFRPALEAIWRNVVSRKMYLTGGIGSRHRGEAFGEDYELPNATGYNETCAAIGNVMWNHRMFLLHGDSKYLDVLERSLYNGFLSGVALDGREFFYANPLESDGVYAFNIENVATRSPWFTCSCCPTNVVRFFPSLPGYAFAQNHDTVFVNLFIQGRASIDRPQGPVELRLRTRYPWEGRVAIDVDLAEPQDFTLALRLPGWARNRPVPSDLYRYQGDDPGGVEIRLNGESVPFGERLGFARLQRRWTSGDRVELDLPLVPRQVGTHPAVEENAGRIAIEQGPLVYCAEAADDTATLSTGDKAVSAADRNKAGRPTEPSTTGASTGPSANGAAGDGLGLTLSRQPEFHSTFEPDLLGGVNAIRAGAATLIPYYAWSHRGVGAMQVWLSQNETSPARGAGGRPDPREVT